MNYFQKATGKAMFFRPVEISQLAGWISNLPPQEQLDAWQRLNELALAAIESEVHTRSYWDTLEIFTSGGIVAHRIQYSIKE